MSARRPPSSSSPSEKGWSEFSVFSLWSFVSSPDQELPRVLIKDPRLTSNGRTASARASASANPSYARVPEIVQRAMDRVGAIIGRPYSLFRYSGHPQAERVVVVIGLAFEVLDETAAWLNAHREKVGVLHVALYPPWGRGALPGGIAPNGDVHRGAGSHEGSRRPGRTALSRCPATFAEALSAGRVASMPVIIGGRFGLSSKDFDPAMAKAVFDDFKKREPKRGFTIGITA